MIIIPTHFKELLLLKTEVHLDVLYNEVKKNIGDKLNEENVIKYLKNKYKK